MSVLKGHVYGTRRYEQDTHRLEGIGWLFIIFLTIMCNEKKQADITRSFAFLPQVTAKENDTARVYMVDVKPPTAAFKVSLE